MNAWSHALVKAANADFALKQAERRLTEARFRESEADAALNLAVFAADGPRVLDAAVKRLDACAEAAVAAQRDRDVAVVARMLWMREAAARRARNQAGGAPRRLPSALATS